MNLQHVKQRRLAALEKCNSDRVLVSPAKYKSDMRLPSAETVAAYLIDALKAGFTVQQLEAETGWSKSRIMANLYKVAKKTGVGIQRSSERLFIVWPDEDEDVAIHGVVMDDDVQIDELRTVAA